MFTIIRRGSDWVLRAEGADILVVGSKTMAKRIMRDAAIRIVKARPAGGAAASSATALARPAGDRQQAEDVVR